MFSINKDISFTKLLTDNLQKRYERNGRGKDEPIHISDLIDSSCLRKQYYGRKYPRQDVVNDSALFSFVRGESSEKIITDLANIGAAQVRVEVDGLVARPLTKKENFLVVELKDSASVGKRLEPDDFKFKAYMQQLLYYLVITGIEKGTLCITYSNHEMIWTKRDSEGDHFLKPKDAKPPGIESWNVFLSLDDPLRQSLHDELLKRKNRFLGALTEGSVENLPRLTGIYKKLICKSCVFMDRCFGLDGETLDAIKFSTEPSLLDGILFK